MPSPFPGMDPYLEGDMWTTVHFQLAAEIVHQLAPKLRPRYVAWAERYQVLENPEAVAITSGSSYPDVGIVSTGRAASEAARTATVSVPVRMTTVMPQPVPHVRMVIRDSARRKLVTVIEIGNGP